MDPNQTPASVNPQQENRPAAKPNRWGFFTWAAVALIPVDAIVILLHGSSLLDICEFLVTTGIGLTIIAPVVILWLVLLILRLIRNSKDIVFRATRSAVLFLAVAVPLSILAEPILWVISLNASLETAKAKLSHDADIPAIRQWAQQYKPDIKDDLLPDGDVAVAPQNLPPCLKKLDPTVVFFSAKTKQVMIDRGGGFVGHWGLTITATDVKTFHHE